MEKLLCVVNCLLPLSYSCLIAKKLAKIQMFLINNINLISKFLTDVVNQWYWIGNYIVRYWYLWIIFTSYVILQFEDFYWMHCLKYLWLLYVCVTFLTLFNSMVQYIIRNCTTWIVLLSVSNLMTYLRISRVWNWLIFTVFKDFIEIFISQLLNFQYSVDLLSDWLKFIVIVVFCDKST